MFDFIKKRKGEALLDECNEKAKKCTNLEDIDRLVNEYRDRLDNIVKSGSPLDHDLRDRLRLTYNDHFSRISRDISMERFNSINFKNYKGDPNSLVKALKELFEEFAEDNMGIDKPYLNEGELMRIVNALASEIETYNNQELLDFLIKMECYTKIEDEILNQLQEFSQDELMLILDSISSTRKNFEHRRSLWILAVVSELVKDKLKNPDKVVFVRAGSRRKIDLSSSGGHGGRIELFKGDYYAIPHEITNKQYPNTEPEAHLTTNLLRNDIGGENRYIPFEIVTEGS